MLKATLEKMEGGVKGRVKEELGLLLMMIGSTLGQYLILHFFFLIFDDWQHSWSVSYFTF